MNFFDNFWGRCFTLGMMVSHAFAAALYLSIALLTLFTIGQITVKLLSQA